MLTKVMGNAICTSYAYDRPRELVLRHRYPRCWSYCPEEYPRVKKAVKGLEEFLSEQKRIEKDRKDREKYRCKKQHVEDLPPGLLPLEITQAAPVSLKVQMEVPLHAQMEVSLRVRTALLPYIPIGTIGPLPFTLVGTILLLLLLLLLLNTRPGAGLVSVSAPWAIPHADRKPPPVDPQDILPEATTQVRNMRAPDSDHNRSSDVISTAVSEGESKKSPKEPARRDMRDGPPDGGEPLNNVDQERVPDGAPRIFDQHPGYRKRSWQQGKAAKGWDSDPEHRRGGNYEDDGGWGA
ncbi:hypothetical protein MMC13_006827 [Lambiella insularis]|nr:hypothetical protein [Lambiella insularis]